jgi:hypothetical protein
MEIDVFLVPLNRLELAVNSTTTITQNVIPSVFTSDPFWLVVSALAAVILTLAVQNYLNRPKIWGNIYTVIRNQFVLNLVGKKIDRAGFVTYLYLTNLHQNSIHIIDFEGEVDFGEGYIKLQRAYGDIDFYFTQGLTATMLGGPNPTNFTFDMALLKGRLIYKKDKPVGFGDFLDGFVVFLGDPSLVQKKIVRMRVTCIDSLGKRHTFEKESKKFLDFSLMMERFSGMMSIPDLPPPPTS